MSDSLFYSALENIFWITSQTCRELKEHGTSSWWWQVRWALYKAWFGYSPNLAIHKYFKEHHPELLQENNYLPDDCGDLTYGETLPGTAYHLLKTLEIGPQSKVVDLGCGRGVFSLVAGAAFGAESIGCDLLEDYIIRGNKAASYLNLQEKVKFQLLDFTKDPLPSADLYFLSATCLQEETWQKLLTNLHRTTKHDDQALSISQPLPHSLWQLQMRANVPFTWGEATIYAYSRK